MHTSPTGPVQNAARPWRDGELEISFPPAKPLGSEADFSEGLIWTEDKNDTELRAGIPDLCWINAGVPFLSLDTVSDIKNCCLRTAYARIIQLVYEEEFATITQFFTAWLGTASVSSHGQSGTMPAMSLVTTTQYALAFVSGTTTFQQFATQATTGFAGPTNFGNVKTIPLWFDCATLISERLEAMGVDNALPLILVGHSYGGAACAVLAIRQKRANPDKKLFVLTYGMPKPCDTASMRVLETTNKMFVFNVDDFVPQLPIAFYQGNWFPTVLSMGLRRAWGEWEKSTEYLIQEFTGVKRIDHLPDLTADVIGPLLAELFFFGELAPINAHRISEYIIRSCRGCRCPRWPFEAPEWGILFDYVCGERGFRFAVQVVEDFPVLDPQVKVKFRVDVLDIPLAPPLCYSLCLHSVDLQYAVGDNLPTFSNTEAFTFAYFFKRAFPNALMEIDQYDDVSERVFAPTIYTDGVLYAHVPVSGGYAFGQAFVDFDTDWHHVAIVYDGTLTGNANRLKVYYDAVPLSLAFTGTIPAMTATNGGQMIVGQRVVADQFSDGDFAYLLAFPRALDGGDVAELANNTINPLTLDPDWFVPFAEGEGTIAADYSGSGLDLILQNDAGWCDLGCLPPTASRWRWSAEIVDDVNPAVPAKFKWSTEVEHVEPPGPEDSKFKWSTEVLDGSPVGNPILAKEKFRVALWERTIAGSTLSIKFDAADEQRLEFADGFGGNYSSLTLMFFAKRPAEGHGGIISIDGMGDPASVAEMKVIDDGGLKVIGKVSGYVDDELFETECPWEPPITQGWHHYAMVFTQGLDPEFNSIAFYFDGVLQSSSPPTSPSHAGYSRGGEMFRVGLSQDGEFTNGLMDNVCWTTTALDASTILAIASADLDPADLGCARLFEFELDEDPQAWDTVEDNFFDGFVNDPEHSEDVPPLLAD